MIAETPTLDKAKRHAAELRRCLDQLMRDHAAHQENREAVYDALGWLDCLDRSLQDVEPAAAAE